MDETLRDGLRPKAGYFMAMINNPGGAFSWSIHIDMARVHISTGGVTNVCHV